MHLHAPSDIAKRGSSLAGLLDHWFPVPKMLYQHSAGIDISDSSIKWLQLRGAENKKDPIVSWGEVPLAEGIVVNGFVKDVPALVAALQDVHSKSGGIVNVHAALPEEAAYIFGMHVPGNSTRKSVLSTIEFELPARVPIPPNEAVYDFDVIVNHDDGGQEIGVVVFPRELAEGYAAAFRDAGLRLLSLEVEARSIARAVSSDSAEEPITLLVDFGRARTGFAILKRGVPIFTSTVNVGGAAMTSILAEKLSLSKEDAESFKNDKGLLAAAGEKSPTAEALISTVSALADEIVRHYHYWDTRRNDHGERVTPVENVFLVGGNANLKGLGDYISARVQAPVAKPNVWRHVCSFDEYIPPIDRRTSLQYATAVGLALRGV